MLKKKNNMKNQKFKEPFSYIFIESLTTSFSLIIFILLFNIEFFSIFINGYLLFGLLGLYILILIYKIMVWYRTNILITDTVLEVEKNTLFSSKKTVKISNVSNIDSRQNIVQKLLKIATVIIDTNVSGSELQSIKIILTLKDLPKFKGSLSVNVPVNKEEEKYDYYFGYKTMIVNSLLSTNIFLIIVSSVAYLPMLFIDDIFKFFNLFSFAIILVPFLISVLSSLSKLYNFKVKIDKDKISLSYGLFSTIKNSIPLNKINGIKLNEPLFARIVGRQSVNVINVGANADENSISFVLPLLSKIEIKKKMEHLFPEYKNVDDLIAQPKTSILANIFSKSILLMISIVLGFVINFFLGTFTIILWVVYFLLSYKLHKISISQRIVYIVRGSFNKTTVVFGLDKVEQIRIISNPIANILKLKKCEFILLANSVDTRQMTGYFNQEIIDSLLELYK